MLPLKSYFEIIWGELSKEFNIATDLVFEFYKLLLASDIKETWDFRLESKLLILLWELSELSDFKVTEAISWTKVS